MNVIVELLQTTSKKFDIGKMPVCSICGKATDGILKTSPKCHSKATHYPLRKYVEEVLKKEFDVSKWKIETKTINLTKDVNLNDNIY